MKSKTLMISILTALFSILLLNQANAESVTSGDYQYKVDSGKATLLRYLGPETGTLILPEQLDGHSVTAIGESVFLSNMFTSVVIPAGVVSITPGAFSSCVDLASIQVAAGNTVYEQVDGVLFDKTKKTLHTYPAARAQAAYQVPEGTTGIQTSAFYMAAQLTSLALPNSITEIGETAFYGCSGLLTVSIPQGVTAIGSRAFSLCSSMQAVSFPASITSIGVSLFEYCTSLIEVHVDAANPVYEVLDGVLFDKTQRLLHTYPPALPNTSYQVPDGTQTIGNLAFANSQNLEFLQIPDSVTTIQDGAFSGSMKLKDVVLPNGLTRIEANLFAACKDLAKIQIPASVQTIGPQSFYNCEDLNQVSIPFGVTAIEAYAFAYCNYINTITIPGSVVTIGEGAFMAADWISSIQLPSSVQSIGPYAFSECSSMTSISIPASVTSIGDSAFYSSGRLTAIVEKDSYAHTYFSENKLSFTIGNP